MTPTVWLIYDDDDCIVDVCATAEDCACCLVDKGDNLLDDTILVYSDSSRPWQERYTTIRKAAQEAGKTNLDFVVEVLKGYSNYWLPWRITEEHVRGGYEHILK